MEVMYDVTVGGSYLLWRYRVRVIHVMNFIHKTVESPKLRSKFLLLVYIYVVISMNSWFYIFAFA